jgi:transcriptional regulator GlxA family with amidase domain
MELATTINKLVKECMSTSITKDVLADLTLQELLIRIIQTQTAKAIEEGSFKDPNNPITEVIEFIRSNLRENITLKRLSEKSCMSTTSFYRLFKRELGMSPIDFTQVTQAPLQVESKEAPQVSEAPQLTA